MDLTKRQQEIFDFIKRYSAARRLPTDRPGHRQGGGPGLVLDGARPPGQSGADRAAPPRSDEAASDRAARPGRRRGARASSSPGLPLVGQVAAGQPMLAEENIEEYIADARVRRRRGWRVSCCGSAASR